MTGRQCKGLIVLKQGFVSGDEENKERKKEI